MKEIPFFEWLGYQNIINEGYGLFDDDKLKSKIMNTPAQQVLLEMKGRLSNEIKTQKEKSIKARAEVERLLENVIKEASEKITMVKANIMMPAANLRNLLNCSRVIKN